MQFFPSLHGIHARGVLFCCEDSPVSAAHMCRRACAKKEGTKTILTLATIHTRKGKRAVEEPDFTEDLVAFLHDFHRSLEGEYIQK